MGFRVKAYSDIVVRVTCEACEHEYNYTYRFEIVGFSSTANNWGSIREAELDAAGRFEKKITEIKRRVDNGDYDWLSPKRCQSCNCMQSWMLNFNRNRMVNIISTILAVVSVIPIGAIISSALFHRGIHEGAALYAILAAFLLRYILSRVLRLLPNELFFPSDLAKLKLKKTNIPALVFGNRKQESID